VSAPDCVTAANIVAEAAPVPQNATYIRVQHIGDPGTAELAGEVANVVTWGVGDLTGFYPQEAGPTGAQRGYRNEGPPVAASVFQLQCNGAGFLINTFQFSHTQPLVGEGPSASVFRDLLPEAAVFPNASATLTLEATVNVKTAAYQAPHTADGTAQVSFVYYARDTTTNTYIAHVIELFDSRPLGTSGVGQESVSSDGVVNFVESPLLMVDTMGAPLKYVSVGPSSDTLHTQQAWGQPSLFRAQVPYAKFQALLLRLKAGPLPAISARPEDYRVTGFGVLGEVFPGTGSEHNVTLGASLTDLRLTGG